MLELKIKLKGIQTETYCSIGSGIGACEKLNREGICLMYNSKLKYNASTDSYERCNQCLKSEIVE